MTHNNDCNQLDAYLTDDLSADDARRFESHLEKCSDCREAIDEQNWIDSLLQSPVRTQIEHTPETILDSVRPSIAQRDRGRLQVVYGFAAAAVLLIGVGWVVRHRPAVDSKASETQDVAVVKPILVPHHVQPQATFVATADAIVVPLESQSSDVTIVQVYQTTDTERRRRFEQTLLSASTIPNGG